MPYFVAVIHADQIVYYSNHHVATFIVDIKICRIAENVAGNLIWKFGRLTTALPN